MTRHDMGVLTVGLAKVDIVGDSGVNDCWGGDSRVCGSWGGDSWGGDSMGNHSWGYESGWC